MLVGLCDPGSPRDVVLLWRSAIGILYCGL